ncbi:MAG: hypothetical protein LC109_13785 [Bacteroidia bacterium]|nr:hypothetical protein [Bacteroidia bacterium]
MRKIITAFSVILFAFQSQAQNATKYSNEFLTLGVGARSMGMGNVAVSLTDDVFAGYWNPAGLVDIQDKIQASFMHSAYFAGIANYDYLGIATKPTENSALGLTVLRFGVDGILNTLDLIKNGEINYDRISQFSAVDYAFIAHYAQTVDMTRLNSYSFFQDSKLSWGVNTKVINRKAGPFATAWGFGFDAGARLTGLKYGWSFGVMAKDITTTFNTWSYSFSERDKEVFAQTGNEIPINTLELTLPRLILGVGKKWDLKKFEIITATDFEITTDGKRNTLIKSNPFSIDPKLGAEFSYKFKDESNRVSLRMGIGNIQKETNKKGNKITSFMPTVGVGIKIKSFSIDYALTDIGDMSAALYSNIISVRFGFDAANLKK